jgi:hypothetical protein
MVLATALLVHGRSGLDSEKHGQKAVLALKWTLLSQKFCGNLCTTGTSHGYLYDGSLVQGGRDIVGTPEWCAEFRSGDQLRTASD